MPQPTEQWVQMVRLISGLASADALLADALRIICGASMVLAATPPAMAPERVRKPRRVTPSGCRLSCAPFVDGVDLGVSFMVSCSCFWCAARDQMRAVL